jgi:hypothetical protein
LCPLHQTAELRRDSRRKTYRRKQLSYSTVGWQTVDYNQ